MASNYKTLDPFKARGGAAGLGWTVVTLAALLLTAGVVALALIVEGSGETDPLEPISLSFAPLGTSVPLILDLHGAGATPKAQKDWSQLDRCAMREGWHIHYPMGLQRTWNAGPGMYEPAASSIDHVKALKNLADELRVRLNASHVFVSGLSNGCAMALRLGLEAYGAFDAVACTSHAMHPNITGIAQPPMLLLNGDEDVRFASPAAVEHTLNAYTDGTCEFETVPSEPDVVVRRAVNCSKVVEHVLFKDTGHFPTPERTSARMCTFFKYVSSLVQTSELQ